jgi:hypothetical protein
MEPAVENCSLATGHVGYRGPVAFCEGIGIGEEGLSSSIPDAFRLYPGKVSQQLCDGFGQPELILGGYGI